jgi:prepilin-type N-terminal cleavage/methylation domain-containing protein
MLKGKDKISKNQINLPAHQVEAPAKRFGRQGLTLIETLMAIAIFAVGIQGFAVLFMRAWQINSYTMEMGQSALAVSRGVNTIVDYLRSARQADNGAYPIQSASNNDIVFYSDYDHDGITERLHIYKSGQNILMGVTNPTTAMPKTYPTADQEVITIATRIVNTTSQPIFFYYDKNYAGASNQTSLAMPVSVSLIRLMKIHLKINIDPNRAPDNIESQTFVEMRNLNDS